MKRHLVVVGAVFLVGCGDGVPEEPASSVGTQRGALLTSQFGSMIDVNHAGGVTGRVQEMFLARSVPTLIDVNSFGADNVLRTYRFNLCPGEEFEGTVAITKSPLGIGCSSALVGNRLLLTSNHCLYDESLNQVSLDRFRAVFGYRRFGSRDSLAIPQEDIYTPISIVDRGHDFGTGDWALLLLDRPVSWRYRRLQIGGNPAVNERVHMIGYPMLMPEKLSIAGPVFAVDAFMFRANVSGMAGNSGSPVFTAAGVIAGILSSGPDDTVWDPDLACNRWYVHPTAAMVAKDANTARDALAAARQAAFLRSLRRPPPRPLPWTPTVSDLASGPSCAGACNGRSPDGCGCDAACGSRGDCCPDAGNCAPYWTAGADSCASSCGGQAPGMCWCDRHCPAFGDCCGDFFDTCGRW